MVGLVAKSYSPYLLPKLYSVWLKNVPKTYDNEISVRTNRDRPHLFLKSWVTLLFITEYDSQFRQHFPRHTTKRPLEK